VKTEVVEFAENSDTRVLQRRINGVEAHDRAPSLREAMSQCKTDELRSAGD
jgi:hypothetical protein